MHLDKDLHKCQFCKYGFKTVKGGREVYYCKRKQHFILYIVLRCSFFRVDEDRVRRVVRGSVEVRKGVERGDRTLDSWFK